MQAIFQCLFQLCGEVAGELEHQQKEAERRELLRAGAGPSADAKVAHC